MSDEENTYRVAIFIAAVVALYGMAGIMLIGAVIQRRANKHLSAPWLWFRRLVFTTAIFGTLCIAYGYFIEPFWLETTHVRIQSTKLSKELRPIKFVLISDLHCDQRHLREDDLPALIEKEHPDGILFTGDCANRPDQIPRFQNILKQIAAIAPTYVIRGNWDSTQWRNLKIFENTGAHELNGKSEQVQIAGQKFAIAGIDYGSENLVGQALHSIPAEEFCLLISHSPDLVPAVDGKSVDLFCAGHTHGGQVALPFYGAIITICRLGKKFEAGLYDTGTMKVYVNRGIGVDGWGPRVRFLARPEMTVIELVGAKSN